QIRIFGFDAECASARHGIARVQREVDEYLLELRRIGADRAQIGITNRLQLDVFTDESGEHIAGLAKRIAHIQNLRAEHLPFAEPEQMTDERIRALSRLLDTQNFVAQRIFLFQTAENENAIAA